MQFTFDEVLLQYRPPSFRKRPSTCVRGERSVGLERWQDAWQQGHKPPGTRAAKSQNPRPQPHPVSDDVIVHAAIHKGTLVSNEAVAARLVHLAGKGGQAIAGALRQPTKGEGGARGGMGKGAVGSRRTCTGSHQEPGQGAAGLALEITAFRLTAAGASSRA